MTTLTHIFENQKWENVVKSYFKKYMEEVYFAKNVVVEMYRKLENENLTIYRVHYTFISGFSYVFNEKIEINRKLQKLKSNIDTKLVFENCFYSVDELNPKNILYKQYYDVIFGFSNKKKEAFNKGIEIMDKILKRDFTL